MTLEMTVEEVIRAGFAAGDPDALIRARQIRDKLIREAAQHEARAKVADKRAVFLRLQVKSIDEIVAAMQPHWTPRVGDGASPTPETVVKSRKKRHDPIRALFDNGKITPDQKRAAEKIAEIFEEISRLSNFKPRDLGAGLGGIPKKSGKKTSVMREDVAVEHRLVYKPWAARVSADPSLSLPTIIDLVVFHVPLRTLSGRHGTIVEMLKDALDSYLDMEESVSYEDREAIGTDPI